MLPALPADTPTTCSSAATSARLRISSGVLAPLLITTLRHFAMRTTSHRFRKKNRRDVASVAKTWRQSVKSAKLSRAAPPARHVPRIALLYSSSNRTPFATATSTCIGVHRLVWDTSFTHAHKAHAHTRDEPAPSSTGTEAWNPTQCARYPRSRSYTLPQAHAPRTAQQQRRRTRE